MSLFGYSGFAHELVVNPRVFVYLLFTLADEQYKFRRLHTLQTKIAHIPKTASML
jgi:hypothetical protein